MLFAYMLTVSLSQRTESHSRGLCLVLKLSKLLQLTPYTTNDFLLFHIYFHQVYDFLRRNSFDNIVHLIVLNLTFFFQFICVRYNKVSQSLRVVIQGFNKTKTKGLHAQIYFWEHVEVEYVA